MIMVPSFCNANNIYLFTTAQRMCYFSIKKFTLSLVLAIKQKISTSHVWRNKPTKAIPIAATFAGEIYFLFASVSLRKGFNDPSFSRCRLNLLDYAHFTKLRVYNPNYSVKFIRLFTVLLYNLNRILLVDAMHTGFSALKHSIYYNVNKFLLLLSL